MRSCCGHKPSEKRPLIPASPNRDEVDGVLDAKGEPGTMLSLVRQLLATGKTVLIATPSWQSVAIGHQDMSQLAAQVPLIVQHFAGQHVYAGPDMFAFFSQPAN